MSNRENSSDEENQLRFENELKKLKLIAESGAHVFEQSKLSPEAESQWLDHISAFNQAAQEKKTITIREKLGNIELPAVEILNESQLILAIDSLLSILYQNGISLTVIHKEDVPDEQLYRFMTGEFMDYEMNDINIIGMMSCFTYEEFHPNFKEDIKEVASEFLKMLCSKSFEIIDTSLAKEVRYNGTQLLSKEFIGQLRNVMRQRELTIHTIFPGLPEIVEDYSKLDIKVKYDISVHGSDKHAFTEDLTMEFVLQHGYWCINKIHWPNFKLTT